MAKKPTPLAGEATTTNYGWVKPTVGSSVDLWGGYINADLDSIDGVVHAIDTRPVGVTVSDTPPANPLVGQEWFDSVSGQLYVWYNDGNSSQWVIAVNAAASLLPASTTVLGGVKVDGTTIKAAPDGTISTTVVPMGDNRIINGDMRIDARNNGASGTAINVYTADRWAYSTNQAGRIRWQQVSTTGTQFPYALVATSLSAYTPLAADQFQFGQPIEADMVSDFLWGTTSAQAVTLSFWTYSDVAGAFSGSICNAAGTRSYPFTYTVPLHVWTKSVITIPGDTAGTWVMQGNAGAMYVRFDLGCGANSRGPANAWAGANYIGVTGAANLVATNGVNFYLTGVKLEIGSVATPFNRQSLAKSMADCQRYYQTIFPTYRMNSTAPSTYSVGISWAAMRGLPAAALIAAGTRSNMNTIALNPSGANSGYFSCNSTAAGDAYVLGDFWSLSAEL